MRIRRSCLSVPAAELRFRSKADHSNADEVILDLEDSVVPAAKAQARDHAVNTLRTFGFNGKVIAVRINGCASQWCYEDVIGIVERAADRVDCLVIPKVEDADQVHFIDHLLRQIELKIGKIRQIGLELQIESARGLENINAIAAASSRTEALVFGPTDFAASMHVAETAIASSESDSHNDLLRYAMTRIVVAARAYGLQPIDGPYGRVGDLNGLRTAAKRAVQGGFDGKWAINLDQISPINESFTPTQDEFDKATAVIEAYGNAADSNHVGAFLLGNDMIDEASRKMAVHVVERGKALGMKSEQ